MADEGQAKMSLRPRSGDPMSSVLHPALDVARPSPGWRVLMRTRLMRSVVLLEAIVAALVVYGLWSLRDQVVEGEMRTMASFAAAIAAQADSTLSMADTVLRATRLEIERGMIEPGSPDATTLLQTRVSALPIFRELVITNVDGREIAASRRTPDPAPVLDGTDAFDGTLAALGAGNADPDVDSGAAWRLRVGQPGISRIDGRPSLPLTMPWHDQAGRFAGVVELVADPEFLDGSFARAAPSADVSLAIYRRDRELVSDGPGDGGTARSLPRSAIDALWIDREVAQPRILTLPDGTQRLVAAHRLGRAPLLLVLTRDLSFVLAEWTEEALVAGSFTASALLVAFLLALRNSREYALRRASQVALDAQRASALRAFDAAQEGHWEWDPATRDAHFSPRMKTLLGVDRDEVLGADTAFPANARIEPSDLVALREAFFAHLEGRSANFDASFRIVREEGGWRHVRTRGQVQRERDGTPILFSGVASDISAEVEAQRKARELEEQLQRARKLEALGTLAGGVAHDFNNILAAVVGYAELARNKADAGSAFARQLDQILSAGQRGKLLVERILSFSRTGARQHSTFALEPAIDEVVQLLAASLPSKLLIVRRIDPAVGGDAFVSGDSTVMFEVLMNLCTNAIHAMPSGGELRIELDAITTTQARDMSSGPLGPGIWLRLAIADTGEGVAPEAMTRLFEPFFTTKAPNRGTGLGLSIVHSAVQDMGGAIDVESTPGAGTRFSLYFPRARSIAVGRASVGTLVGTSVGKANDSAAGETAAAQERTADAAPAAVSAGDATEDGSDGVPMGSGQTVMVVDDESTLVDLGEELLAGLGYEPVGFSSSLEAFAAFARDPDRFDLVLTDQVMPGMTGTELAVAVHRLRPGLPLVLSTGYGGVRFDVHAREAGVSVMLAKPITRRELARAIERALAAPQRPDLP